MGLFLIVSQICCLLVAANGYIVFSANLEDFRNLAKKLIPEDLVGRLSGIVSESSEYRQRKDLKHGDRSWNDGRGYKKGIGRMDDRYEEVKIPTRSRIDQMLQVVKNNLSPLNTKTPLFPDNDRMRDRDNKRLVKYPHDTERYHEFQYGDKDTTKFTSKIKRYKKVKRMPASDQSSDEASANPLHFTTPRNDKGNPEHPNDSIENKENKMSTRYYASFEKEAEDIKSSTEDEFDYEKPHTTLTAAKKQQALSGRNVKHNKIKHQAKDHNSMNLESIFLNNNKDSYGPLPERDEDYFSKEAMKPTSSKKRPNVSKEIGRADSNRYSSFENEDTMSPVLKKTILKKRPGIDHPERSLEEDVEHKTEVAKAKTANLLLNSKESETEDPQVMEGAGISNREHYKISDYYKKQPRIREKYDFDEPLLQSDRERETLDNMKWLKKHLENTTEKSRHFKAMLKELGISR